MKILVLLVIVFLQFSFIHAQNKDDFQTWIDYTTNNWISSEWLYKGDYGARGLLSVDEWTQYYINPAFVFRTDKKLTYHGGVKLVYSSNLLSSNTVEMRPWQGVQYIWPRLDAIYFDHYLRLEERLVWQTDVSEFDFSLRGRYRIRMRTLDFRLPLIPTKFNSFASLEVFMDLTDRIVENYVGRHRLTFGIGNHVAKDFLIELHYILQKSSKGSSSLDESNDHIFRIRVKHNVAKGLFFN